MLDGENIAGGFNNAQQRVVASGIGTDSAQLRLRQIAAALAAPYNFRRVRQGLAQRASPLAIAFE
jgi:hypothetical protein